MKKRKTKKKVIKTPDLIKGSVIIKNTSFGVLPKPKAASSILGLT